MKVHMLIACTCLTAAACDGLEPSPDVLTPHVDVQVELNRSNTIVDDDFEISFSITNLSDKSICTWDLSSTAFGGALRLYDSAGNQVERPVLSPSVGDEAVFRVDRINSQAEFKARARILSVRHQDILAAEQGEYRIEFLDCDVFRDTGFTMSQITEIKSLHPNSFMSLVFPVTLNRD